jgi:hypothetical protein
MGSRVNPQALANSAGERRRRNTAERWRKTQFPIRLDGAGRRFNPVFSMDYGGGAGCHKSFAKL